MKAPFLELHSLLFLSWSRAFESQRKLEDHWSKKPGHRLDPEDMREEADGIEEEQRR